MVFALQSTGLLDACGTDPGTACRLAFNITGNENVARVVDVVSPFVTALLILVVAVVINRIVGRLIDRSTERLIKSYQTEDETPADAATAEDETSARDRALRALEMKRVHDALLAAERKEQRLHTLGRVGRNASAIVIYTIAAFMALGEFDVNLGPLIASAGIAGVALGFGAQSLVRDFLTGIFMLTEDQYGVGDIVDVGEASGTVEEVTLRITKIRDVNGTLWFVPNGEIHRVANKSQEWARAVLDVDVAYDTDLEHAISVIKKVADRVWEQALPEATILEEPEIWGVENFGPDSVSIRLVVKVEPAEQFTAARVLRRKIKDAFDTEGIEIPFPQRTVWLHEVGSEA